MRQRVALFLTLLLAPGPALAEPVDYVRQVKPILRDRCYACHGALRQKSGLRLDAASLLRQGGDSGPAVVPGKPDESVILDAVTGNGRPRMPPESEGTPLAARELALLKAWIEQGAKAPDEPVPEDPRKHWAFQVPVRPLPPRPVEPGRGRNPIDGFVAAAQEAHGLRPSPPADRETLLRRVYLDLVGLPPTRSELHAFLADTSPDAYEKVVDRLLTSPEYGERWGRHWMDVWRYSDWYGRRAVPDVWNSAPQVWRWRDWIVQSLNADKGYDRMVMEMLAADEIAPEDDAAGYATGYLVRNWYALNYNQWMRDLVEHTGKAFLGLTFNCAHCHDHKYDPITQKDYFRFRAFFEPLEVRQDRVPGESDPGQFQKYQYVVLRRVVKVGAVRAFDDKLDAKTYIYLLGDERNRAEGRPPVVPGVPAFLGGDRLRVTPLELPAVAYYPGLKPFIQHDEIERHRQAVAAARAALDEARRGLADARQRLDEVNEQCAGCRIVPPALVDVKARATAAEAAVQLGPIHLAAAEADLQAVVARVAADEARYRHAPGDPDRLARAASKAERFAAMSLAKEKLLAAEQAVEQARQSAGVAPLDKGRAAAVTKAEQQRVAAAKGLETAQKALQAESTVYTPLGPVYPNRSTGRRRALAQWIASRQNPLTARVAVNHIWMRHFGRPLVETVFDFGRNGKKPTHPELLDWLAVEFRESGWSMKHLHRLIVTSRTYRMESRAASAPNLARDADDVWLWHFPRRRAEAEVIRDSVLYTAGQLDRTVGGPVLEPEQAVTSRRRSLHFAIYPEDGGHVKFLETFDPPDPCDCYRRSASIVPQQALVLTNSRLLLDQSRLLARALWDEIARGPGDEQAHEAAFVTAAFEQILTRPPSARERTLCREFLHKQAELFRSARQLPTQGDAAVAPSTEPQMRARESLVRALFSHDDFVTIR
jgi:hypothetical protein